jgi:hypothetical protein
MPPTPAALPADVRIDPAGGVLFVGEKGMLIHDTYGNNPRLIGAGLDEAAKAVPQTLPRIRDGSHEMNWIRAIRGEEAISCPFEYAVPLNETMLLAVAAMRAGQPIDYDGKAGHITNGPDANRYLDREYRKGWEL